MSYKHLTGRLIETQRSMIGEPAIRIARAIDGVTVSDDGAVRSLEGDGYRVVAKLADRYTDILGNAAEKRLIAAADEFRDDVLLPPALGGPAEPEAAAHGRAEGHGPASGMAVGDQQAGVASDGGTVAVPAGPTPAEGPGQSTASSESADAATAAGDGDLELSVPEPHTVEYSLASNVPPEDYGETDLANVYLLPAAGDDWQEPVSIADAVVEAILTATGASEDQVGSPVEAIDVERLLATVNGEHGETVSFGVGDVTVTFHRSGSLAVHE